MYEVKGNTLRISVRNLVEFIYSSGDIDSGSGAVMDVSVMQEGARIHRKLQKSAGSRYHAEVPLKYNIELSDSDGEPYVVAIEGRADGIICDMDEDDEGNKLPMSDVIIDEIKTTRQDVSKMKEAVYVHKAQAMCYAYIFAVRHNLDEITVQMTYCNPLTEEIKKFSELLPVKDVVGWFDGLVAQFKRWSDFVFESRKKRQESIENIEFPFEYREGQKNLVVGVYRSVERGNNLFIQASTGVGKTISTIFPSVMAMGQGMADKIFYLTSKTITRTVADDTYKLLRDNGLYFRSIILTAKEKICPNTECVCSAKDCDSAKGHYDRVNDAVYDMITNNLSIDRDTVTEYAGKHNVCPFEMGLDATYWCDGIICDYNYVFDPNVALKRYFAQGSKKDYIFLVDEAHNLVDRAREMYSAVLVKEHVLETKKLLSEDKENADRKLIAQFERINKHLLSMKRECDTYKVFGGSDSLGRLPEYLSYLAMGIQSFLEKHNNYRYRKELLEFFFEVNHFLNMYDCLDEKYVIYTEHNSKGDFCVNLFCVDPSNNIADRLYSARSTIFFSATLLPVNFFKEMLTGNAEDYAIYAQSTFPRERRRIVIGRDVSSRYTRRNDTEYGKICSYIHETITARNGKYMVFFPSYAYMQKVYDMYVSMYSPYELTEDTQDTLILYTDETKILLQKTDMREQDKEWFLEMFNNSECNGSLIGFCVAGGIFSEGIDLRQDSLIGAVIVGTGLPMICRDRDILRDYFDRQGKDGFSYAYVYPGMNKVLQAAGRVIRTSSDCGVIELLDDRFLNREQQYLFPREWDDIVVTDKNKISEVLSDFWKNIVQ